MFKAKRSCASKARGSSVPRAKFLSYGLRFGVLELLPFQRGLLSVLDVSLDQGLFCQADTVIVVAINAIDINAFDIDLQWKLFRYRF